MKDPKSGFLTSEFFLTVTTNIMGLLVMSGFITSDLANELQVHIAQIVMGIAMVVTSALYIYSRLSLKKSQ